MMSNWKTTLWGLSPLVPYLLNYFHLWPEAIPLPPFDQVWPAIAAAIGIGAAAKDHDVTGGNRNQ